MADPERFCVNVAVHLFLLRSGEVLLLRRFNTGYEDGRYGVPAGHIDGGEEYRAAMIREAQEEIGITIALADLRPVGAIHRLSGDERVEFFFTAERWTGEVSNREPDKCDDLRWYPLDDLPANTITYIRRALANARNGVALDSFGWGESD